MNIILSKTLSWFILSAILPAIVLFIMTGDPVTSALTGLGLGSLKTVAFAVHEYVWSKVVERIKPATVSDRLQERECIIVD